ncbi:hypothetical protein NRB56_76250 [Nocardia sp. RB56]|uniref:Uncharacterized protein n=1 Tax=Nocardia aurantia TaxID=2585199 RepID=A0A7K0E299_9NOCA|nr:hypothetical protein [Nocardia aurantia]
MNSATMPPGAGVPLPLADATCDCSVSTSCRSNFAVSIGRSTPLTVSPGNSSEFCPVFWNDSITWNSGCRACDRAGFRISTSRSNGRSECPNAAMSAARTDSSRSPKPTPPSTSVRSTRVLTNMPIRSSSARSPRPATGVPIAMSVSPDSRDSSSASAAWAAMNRVAPRARANSASRTCTSGSMRKVWVAPRPDATAGRDRSAGRSSCSGSPRSESRQNEICCAMTDSGSASLPRTSRCHSAKSAYCTGRGCQAGSPPSTRAPYAAITSRVSGPIENPSAEMWCTTRARMCSVGLTSNSRARNGTSAVTSKAVSTSSESRCGSSSSVTSTGVRSGMTRPVGTICW